AVAKNGTERARARPARAGDAGAPGPTGDAATAAVLGIRLDVDANPATREASRLAVDADDRSAPTSGRGERDGEKSQRRDCTAHGADLAPEGGFGGCGGGVGVAEAGGGVRGV